MGLQLLLVGIFVAHDPRFLGGLPQGLAIVFAAWVRPGWPGIRANEAWLRVVYVALVLPWLCLQLFYGQPFFRVALGLQPAENFYRQHVALYDDFKALDRLLPDDAVILDGLGYRIGAAYSPRPVFMVAADLPRGRPVYLLANEPESPETARNAHPGYLVGETVYVNRRSIQMTFRTPGSSPILDTLLVIRLIPK